jgi:hypothetical protein
MYHYLLSRSANLEIFHRNGLVTSLCSVESVENPTSITVHKVLQTSQRDGRRSILGGRCTVFIKHNVRFVLYKKLPLEHQK